MNLKWIAYAAMLLDHFAAVFLPSGRAYFILRMFGRLAFPLFVFMAVRGFCLTSNVNAYLKRLFLLALLSQLPFYAAFGLHRLNVLFELCGILLFLSGLQFVIQINSCRWAHPAAAVSFLYYIKGFFLIFSGFLLCTQSEYRISGLLLGVAFYLFRERPGIRTPVCFLLAAGVNSGFYCISALAVPLIAVWERSGWIRIRSSRFCYLIYPVHLLLLAVFRQLFR